MKIALSLQVLLLFCFHLYGDSNLSIERPCPEIHQLPKKKDWALVEKMAAESECTPLINAIESTRVLCEKYGRLGCRKWHLLRTAYYIESNFNAITEKAQFLSKRATGLRHTIEYDPHTDNIFIVLDSKNTFLGSGNKKTVYKAILYGEDPKIVARGEQSAPMDAELRAHHDLFGADGLVKTHAFTTRQDGDKKYTAIYADLYQGTFKNIVKNGGLSFYNKLIIFNDILKGIESIHAKNYVHRDLHCDNYLFWTEKDAQGNDLFRAVIGDLGRAIEISKAANVPVQGARRLYSPEAFRKSRLKGADYFATDMYALGCIFYRIYHNTLPKWQERYMKDKSIAPRAKRKMLVKALKGVTHKRRKVLFQKSSEGTLSVEEDMELLILKMVSRKPDQRGSATYCRQEAERILQRYVQPSSEEVQVAQGD